MVGGLGALTTAYPKEDRGEATNWKVISPLGITPHETEKFSSRGIFCNETYPFQLCIQSWRIICGFRDTGLASQIPFDEPLSIISRFNLGTGKFRFPTYSTHAPHRSLHGQEQ